MDVFARAIKILGCKQLTPTEAENKCLGYWVVHRICKKDLSREVT